MPILNKFVDITYEDGFAIIWIDMKEERMNIISPDLISVFDEVFEQLIQDEKVQAIILTSKKRDFIAGADIKAFKADKKGDFIPILKKGHASLNRIANSKKPIIAAISGTCYGLGTELSLACHARIISDDASSKMALPEVKLGLLPGAGGTQRLPKLIGISKALDMMLTGKNIFPYAAKKMGLVDEVVIKSKLIIAAKSISKQILQGSFKRNIQKTIFDKFLDHTYLGNQIVYHQAKKSVLKSTQGHYPAPFEIIDCVKFERGHDLESGLLFEAEKFESLMLGDVSKELIGLFFSMNDNKKNPYTEFLKPVETIGIIGGGFMGEGIAEVSLDSGFSVVLKDLKTEILEKAKSNVWRSLSFKVSKKILTPIKAEQRIAQLEGTITYQDLKHPGLVIEAVVENLNVKKQILKEIESLGNVEQIIASNTSSLSIKALQESANRPENIIGMHYFSPVSKMPLLEIVVTDQTSKRAMSIAYDIGLRQGKTCIIVNDGPGFYVNRILAPYLNECLLMAEEGIPIETIEKVFQKLGFPVGPFKLLDEVGFDIVVHATNANKDYASKRKGYKPNKVLEVMFNAGFLGKKNGKGFYLYDEKTGVRKSFRNDLNSYFGNNSNKEVNISDIQDRALYLMLQEAMICLEEGIINSKNDGNIAAIFGIGFMPYTGGPFRMIETIGEQNYRKRLNDLSIKYGDRFDQLKK